jgi:hypothetical protein
MSNVAKSRNETPAESLAPLNPTALDCQANEQAIAKLEQEKQGKRQIMERRAQSWRPG